MGTRYHLLCAAGLLFFGQLVAVRGLRLVRCNFGDFFFSFFGGFFFFKDKTVKQFMALTESKICT